MGESDVDRPSSGKQNAARNAGLLGGGKYRVFANLGSGGMADVFVAIAQSPKGTSKLVVVKRLRPDLAPDPSMLGMFLDEARLAARLSHPNLIQTFEIGEEDPGAFIVMEYLEGRSLSVVFEALAAAGKDLPPEVAAKIVAEALAGLHHAHELRDEHGASLGVVHRDVSPQNILVTFDGRVKVLDFGIAKASLNTTQTETGIVKGKIAYMSPEQAGLSAQLDRRADIFSMGIVLWECLAGSRLITGDVTSAAKKIQAMRFTAPSLSNPAVPRELDAIALRALEREPERRFQTAEEMRLALEAYLEQSGREITSEALGAPIAELFADQRHDAHAHARAHADPHGHDRPPPPSNRSEDETQTAAAPAEPNRVGPIEWARGTAPPVPRRQVVVEPVASVRAVQAPPPASARDKGRGVMMTVILGLLGAALLASAVRAIVPESAPAAASPGPPGDAVSPVRVTVRISPPRASLLLDDVPVANPLTATFPRDHRPHRLLAACEGYVSDGRVLRFDGDDLKLDVTLRPLPGAGERADHD